MSLNKSVTSVCSCSSTWWYAVKVEKACWETVLMSQVRPYSVCVCLSDQIIPLLWSHPVRMSVGYAHWQKPMSFSSALRHITGNSSAGTKSGLTSVLANVSGNSKRVNLPFQRTVTYWNFHIIFINMTIHLFPTSKWKAPWSDKSKQVKANSIVETWVVCFIPIYIYILTL